MLVPDASVRVKFTLTPGVLEIAAVGNGDPQDIDSVQASHLIPKSREDYRGPLMHTTNENTCVSIVFFVNAFAMLHDTACTDYPTLNTGKFSTVRACRPTTDLHGAARRSRSFAPSPPHPTRASARSLHQPRDCQVQKSLFLSCESNHPPSG